MIQIKNRYSNEVMFTSENENQTLKEFVESLIAKRAYLSGANLIGAYLSGAIMPIFCKWSIHGIVDGKIRIGCKTRSIEDWDKFFASDEVLTTPRNTPEFTQIRAVYESYKAYLNILNQN